MEGGRGIRRREKRSGNNSGDGDKMGDEGKIRDEEEMKDEDKIREKRLGQYTEIQRMVRFAEKASCFVYKLPLGLVRGHKG